MQFKKIVLALAQLGLISNIGVAAAKENDQLSNINKTDCKQETFWTAWFDNTNQFKGFGNSPSKKEISKAQYLFAENYHTGTTLTKDYQKAIDLFQRAAD